MAKFCIYILALLSFYCYGIQIFNETSKINEQNVRLGEEFIVQIVTDSLFEPLNFLNRDEVRDSIQFLKRKSEPFLKFANMANPKIWAKFNFYFKAIKVTNEAKILKFKYKLKGSTSFITYIIKINVY